MSEPPRKDTTESLLRGFETYDRHVDVVSVFEWIFTSPDVARLPETVAYFERFPRIKGPDGNTLTPDFTVLFNDGTAIVGEIAKIALHPNSVDKLCAQLGKYSEVTSIPSGPGGATVTATHVDVLYLVDMDTGNTAYREVTGRIANPDHPYTPLHPPCIVQFARQANSGYTFQRHLGPLNGALDPGERSLNIGDYLDGDFHPTADRWITVKIDRPFINDPVQKLYLATHLMMRTWNDLYGAGSDDVHATPVEVAQHLQKHYGVGRVSDVRGALDLLDRAGLAAPSADGRTWTVTRSRLRRQNEKDVHRVIAGLLDGKGKRTVPRPRTRQPPPPMDTLFDI